MSRSIRGGVRSNQRWGPVLPDEVFLHNHVTPSSYAAMQWTECVKRTDDMLDQCPPDQVCRLRYEDFVKNPSVMLESILSKLERSVDEAHIRSAVGEVYDRSVGRGNEKIDSDAMTVLVNHAAGSMARHGYMGDPDD